MLTKFIICLRFKIASLFQNLKIRYKINIMQYFKQEKLFSNFHTLIKTCDSHCYKMLLFFIARMNPDYNIYVLFTSQVGFRNTSRLPIFDALSSYKNIHFHYLNLTKYAQNTPLQNWIKNGALFRSSFVNSHTSDVLRYLSLWKYGGTYLDLGNFTLYSSNILIGFMRPH